MISAVTRAAPALALLTALWVRPGVAVVAWDAPGYVCVIKQPRTVLGCHAEPRRLLLGPGGDAAFAPHAHDVYELWQGGERIGVATIGSRVYLPRI